jgi:uncharacterized protein
MGTKQPGNEGGNGGAARFAYHTDDDTPEGGVRRPGARTATGAPGPGERLLDISEIARTVGMRYTHRFHIPPHAADDIDFAAPLGGEITLSNTGALLLLRGHVQTKLRLECGRCLTPIVQDVETDLEEEFDLVTSRNAFQQEEVRAVDEDTPASVIQSNVLDLGELLRQNLLLAAPLQPLCREECPGLELPGRTKTTGAAGEEPVTGDSPLRHLADLLAEKRRSDGQPGNSE